MKDNKRVITVIPARGGSKGIPRKNLRPLAGKPLLYYSIQSCLNAKVVTDVVVTTDDEEIALLAKRFGAKIVFRGEELSSDLVTLDPVILDAYRNISKDQTSEDDLIVTIQPTSPLLGADDIDCAVRQFTENMTDSLVSVVEDKHLTWAIGQDGTPYPKYETRVNRQLLPDSFKESGSIIICTAKQLQTGSRIGERIDLYKLPNSVAIDIDDINDFILCERILLRKKIIFNVIGNALLGLGHAYRAILLANELVEHEILFLVPKSSSEARELIKHHNYDVLEYDNDRFVETALDHDPDLIINDVLDTPANMIKRLRETGIKVINFEDLGPGSHYANLVVNALYDTVYPEDHILSGPSYICLRDEFIHKTKRKPKNSKLEVLLVFGGTDPNGLTERVSSLLFDCDIGMDVHFTIILGPGYYATNKPIAVPENLSGSVSIIEKTSAISEYMADADFAFTSAGRTVYELTAMQTPSVIICQNTREMKHHFAVSDNGLINLGLYCDVDDQDILHAFKKLSLSNDFRDELREKLSQHNLTTGKKTVINLIKELLQNV